MSGNYVGGYGCGNAKLMIIGEAPGENEENSGIPFSGVSGNMINECLDLAGMPRDLCYLTNVVKVRPPNNDIKSLHLLGKKIEDFLPELYDEVKQINPNCIIAVGNIALQALTG